MADVRALVCFCPMSSAEGQRCSSLFIIGWVDAVRTLCKGRVDGSGNARACGSYRGAFESCKDL